MKNLMMKTVKTFKDNVWLSVAAVVLLFCLGLAGWKYSLHIARIFQENNAINTLVAEDTEISGDVDAVETSVRFDLDKGYVSFKQK